MVLYEIAPTSILNCTVLSSCRFRLFSLNHVTLRNIFNFHFHFNFDFQFFVKASQFRTEGSFQIVVPLDDNLFKAKKRAPLPPKDRSPQAAPENGLKMWSNCLECKISDTVKVVKFDPAYFNTGIACATGVSQTSELNLSDGGFVDDVWVPEPPETPGGPGGLGGLGVNGGQGRGAQDSIFTEEGFINEIINTDDMDSVQKDEKEDFDNTANCVCLFLPGMKINQKLGFNIGNIGGSSHTGQMGSSGNVMSSAFYEKERGHVPKNPTFIRL